MFRQLPNSAKPTSPRDGQIWYEQSSACNWVFFNNAWHDMQIRRTPENEDEVVRMIRKMRRAAPELTDMIAKYPLVADAVDQLEVALKLCQNLDDD